MTLHNVTYKHNTNTTVSITREKQLGRSVDEATSGARSESSK